MTGNWSNWSSIRAITFPAAGWQANHVKQRCRITGSRLEEEKHRGYGRQKNLHGSDQRRGTLAGNWSGSQFIGARRTNGTSGIQEEIPVLQRDRESEREHPYEDSAKTSVTFHRGECQEKHASGWARGTPSRTADIVGTSRLER